ncbi:MAG: hypothetical protein HW414_1605 [Dehalococcoidia bacterium]|nr:hypothetical protein [Dehalococcoidia bacterium]
MCWNCVCMMPEADMGSKDDITTESLRMAGKTVCSLPQPPPVTTDMLFYAIRFFIEGPRSGRESH